MTFAGVRVPSTTRSVSTTTIPESSPLSPRLREFLRSVQDRRTRTTADRELARRLHFAVTNARLEASGLSFYVHEGSVSVYGAVRAEALREQVLDLVAEQPGVRRIQDHLQLPVA
jgi:hypothetical protein